MSYPYYYYNSTSSDSTSFSYDDYYEQKRFGEKYSRNYEFRSKLTTILDEVKKKEEVKKQTSFMFDPTGIGEEWPEKKSQ